MLAVFRDTTTLHFLFLWFFSNLEILPFQEYVISVRRTGVIDDFFSLDKKLIEFISSSLFLFVERSKKHKIGLNREGEGEKYRDQVAGNFKLLRESFSSHHLSKASRTNTGFSPVKQ